MIQGFSRGRIPLEYLDYNQSNGFLLPPYLEELIPADHLARVVNQVIDLLDIRELTSRRKLRLPPRCKGWKEKKLRLPGDLVIAKSQKGFQISKNSSFWTAS